MPEYACNWRFLITTPMVYAVALLLIRKAIVEPLLKSFAKRMRIKNEKPSLPKPNTLLEQNYQKLRKKTESELEAIAKKADMTPRQVSNWIRQRINAEKSSPLDKFVFSGWTFAYYFFATVFGFFVMWDKSWTWDRTEIFRGYPFHEPTNGG